MNSVGRRTGGRRPKSPRLPQTFIPLLDVAPYGRLAARPVSARHLRFEATQAEPFLVQLLPLICPLFQAIRLQRGLSAGPSKIGLTRKKMLSHTSSHATAAFMSFGLESRAANASSCGLKREGGTLPRANYSAAAKPNVTVASTLSLARSCRSYFLSPTGLLRSQSVKVRGSTTRSVAP